MQTNYDKDVPFRLNPDVIYTLIDDEAMIMSPTGDDLYSANPMAAKILQFLEAKPMSISAIAQRILEDYAVEEAECVADIQEMLAILHSEGLITNISRDTV